MKYFTLIVLSILSITAFAGELEQRRDELIVQALSNSMTAAIEASNTLVVGQQVRGELNQRSVCLQLATLFVETTKPWNQTDQYVWYWSEYERDFFLELTRGMSKFGTSPFRENALPYVVDLARHRSLYISAAILSSGDTANADAFRKDVRKSDQSYFNVLKQNFITDPDEVEQEKWLTGCQRIVETNHRYDVYFENKAREELNS